MFSVFIFFCRHFYFRLFPNDFTNNIYVVNVSMNILTSINITKAYGLNFMDFYDKIIKKTSPFEKHLQFTKMYGDVE